MLPIELRRTLNIAEKDSLEIYVEDDTIILRKFETRCVFCGNTKNVVEYKGKNICPDCIRDIKNA